MAQDDLENDIEEFDNQEELLRKPATFLKRKRWIAIMEFKNNSCAEARERAERDARAAAGVHTDTFDECDVRLLPPLETKHFAQTLPLSLTFNTI